MVSDVFNLHPYNAAPTSGLTVTPTGVDLTFDPATVTFGAGSASATLRVTGAHAVGRGAG